MLPPDRPSTGSLLARIDASDVWGVGHRLEERLALIGIDSAQDLARADLKTLRRRFSITLERTALELRGISCLEMNEANESRQRIMTSRSFGTPTETHTDIHQALRHFGQRSAEKLRAQNSLTRAVYVFLQTNRHRPDLQQYSPGRIVGLSHPTADSREILNAVSQAFHAMYRPHYRFMKAGGMLMDLIDADRQQLSLLNADNEAARDHSDRLMATLEAINQSMGPGTIKLGTSTPNADWHLRCAYRSPRWSTRWPELPAAKAR